MFRPPPSFTLFPYTTLFRSAALTMPKTVKRVKRVKTLVRTAGGDFGRSLGKVEKAVKKHKLSAACSAALSRTLRSEEHTSELQSPYDLVCRLLLEKKNKTIN